jgi:hypothetical protein
MRIFIRSLGCGTILLACLLCGGACKDDDNPAGPSPATSQNVCHGCWNLVISDFYTGTAVMMVDSAGNVAGTLTATYAGQNMVLSIIGVVSKTGVLTAFAYYEGKKDAFFEGTFSETAGSGYYYDTELKQVKEGSWTATRKT